MTTREIEERYREACGLFYTPGSPLPERRRAEEIFDAILREDPRHHQSWNMLGLCHETQGHRGKAREAFDRAVALEPRDVYFINLGISLAHDDRLDEAATAFGRAIEAEPSSPAAHCNLGNIRHLQGRIPEAVLSWEQALELDPAYEDLHANLALGLLDLGRRNEARKVLADGIALFPNSVELVIHLAQLHEGDGRPAEAADLWETFIRSNPHKNQQLLDEARGFVRALRSGVPTAPPDGQQTKGR